MEHELQKSPRNYKWEISKYLVIMFVCTLNIGADFALLINGPGHPAKAVLVVFLLIAGAVSIWAITSILKLVDELEARRVERELEADGPEIV